MVSFYAARVLWVCNYYLSVFLETTDCSLAIVSVIIIIIIFFGMGN